jgi:hypothetical protein
MTQQPAAPDAVKVEQAARDLAKSVMRIVLASPWRESQLIELGLQAFANFEAEHCRPNLTQRTGSFELAVECRKYGGCD